MGVSALFLVGLLAWGCDARPDGAPRSACLSLTPHHSGIAPQRSAAPFVVSVTKNGRNVQVKLFSSVGEEFEGFVIQARYAKDKSRMVDGSFTTREGVTKTINCFDGTMGNTLTFVTPSRKREVVTDWTPTIALDEDVIFRATFAKTFALFWTEVDSKPVRIQNDGPTRSPMERKESSPASGIYTDCSVSKGCFGIPSGCINKEDCEVLLSYSKAKDVYEFQLYGTLDEDSYMAMGLSNDNLMGDDAVTECVRRGPSVQVHRSWNVGKSNNHLRELENGPYESSFINGMSECSFTLHEITEINGRVFNLANNSYYTLLAKGPMRNERLSYHSSQRGSSSQPMNFNAFEVGQAEGVTNSIKIHGTFMVTAWIGFVSIGILLARHFKASWDRTLCGLKIWFALHRLLMLVALCFVAVAFIVIFVHKDGWNYETKNPHAILGCLATILGFLQPIMALFRPGPDHPKRPIFNWLHFTVGNSAQLIALIAIFYAKTLESSGLLDDNFYAVLAVFIVVYLLFHLFFQVHTMTSERKKNNEVKMLDLASRGNATQNGAPEKNLVNQALRQILLGIYTIFVVAILITLYALIIAA